MSAHRTQWSDEHGDDGLRDKFSVYKTADATHDIYVDTSTTLDVFDSDGRVGTSAPRSPSDEFVFVLRPESDEAAWLALQEYAARVTKRSPLLAHQLREQLVRIYRNQESLPS